MRTRWEWYPVPVLGSLLRWAFVALAVGWGAAALAAPSPLRFTMAGIWAVLAFLLWTQSPGALVAGGLALPGTRGRQRVIEWGRIARIRETGSQPLVLVLHDGTEHVLVGAATEVRAEIVRRWLDAGHTGD